MWVFGGQTYLSVTQYFAMADTQCLNPPLLTTRQRNEESQLDQFWLGEMRVQLLPEFVISDARIPQNGTGVAQCRLLAVVKPVRIFESQQIVVVTFG